MPTAESSWIVPDSQRKTRGRGLRDKSHRERERGGGGGEEKVREKGRQRVVGRGGKRECGEREKRK